MNYSTSFRIIPGMGILSVRVRYGTASAGRVVRNLRAACKDYSGESYRPGCSEPPSLRPQAGRG